MVKQAKFFRLQAAKAERLARTTDNSETALNFSSLADAYRSQADALRKSNKETAKKKKLKGRKPKQSGE